MKRLLTTMLALCALITGFAADRLTSPDGHLSLEAGVAAGCPFYTLTRDGVTVIDCSQLGLRLADGAFDGALKIVSRERDTKDETWVQVWGEDDTVRCHYNELTLNLRAARGARLAITFRLFNDGLGFRYTIPARPGVSEITLLDELTEFVLPADVPAWSIPTNRTTYYENIYRRELLSDKDTVHTPLTIEAAPDLYLAIHQAALVDYADLNLAMVGRVGKGVKLLSALTPWHDGVKVHAGATLTTPWRTVIVASQPGDLITSRLMLNLNEPCKIEDTSWIKPGRYVGIWWGIHKKHATWEQGPIHGATTANMKRYIDFAAAHGFTGVLAEGWNYGWGEGEKLSFTRSYPDYDLPEIARYAHERGVDIVVHNETWGAAREYEAQMDSAFALYESLGLHAIKSGYVGQLDGIELQHSQYGARHYRKVIEKAAAHRIMVDNHEPMMPTGIQRTYPNLMTQEGVRGQEYNAWSVDGGNPPAHEVTLPFTRGLAGPMDYTPTIVTFTDDVVPGTRPHTTLAKQLAEMVVLYSPLQMAADEIENYEASPLALSFIETVPTTWSRMVVPHGKIGHYITVARRERGGDSWWIGSMTGDEAATLPLKLDFLDAGARYRAFIYGDGEAAPDTNPDALTVEQRIVNASTTLTLRMVRSGGAAIRLVKLP